MNEMKSQRRVRRRRRYGGTELRKSCVEVRLALAPVVLLEPTARFSRLMTGAGRNELPVVDARLQDALGDPIVPFLLILQLESMRQTSQFQLFLGQVEIAR